MAWLYLLASLALLAFALGIAQHHLGSYMARVLTCDKDTKVETFCYRLMGVDPRAGQTWKSYARSVLAFSFCGVVLLYALQRLQSWLPWSMGKGSVSPAVAFNTAVSFVTNTNWQAYSPEVTLGHFVQLAGLCVQNFVSAATGIAVAIALVRGFVGRGEHTIGNFWVDLTRTTLRILMPIAAVGAFLLIVGGAAQNFIGFMHVTGIAGGDQIIPGGPVASQEVIKELGTNGGGFFNGNSSHPFENPQPWTNMLKIFLILLIPFSLPRTFGKMVKDVRQGRAILISMIVLFLINLFAMAAAEFSGHITDGRVPTGFSAVIAVWLWLTVVFANLAESIAEGRGKAQAETLRKTRTAINALRVDGWDEQIDPSAEHTATTEVVSSDLKYGDVVVVTAGQTIPGDGDIIWGIASVDESAITGESAPVVRESGGDRSAVTGGTKVLSDRIVVKITSKPGQSFVDRMIALVEGSGRRKTPNEIALNILLASLSIVFVIVALTLNPIASLAARPVSITVLVALLVCLIPTTIGGHRYRGYGPPGAAQCAGHVGPSRRGRW